MEAKKSRPARIEGLNRPTKAKYKAPKLSAEEKLERAQRRQWDKEDRERLKLEKSRQREQKQANKIELAILNFMLKTDVLYYHHGRSESMKNTIKSKIESVKETGRNTEYDPYIWNYQGEGKNYMPKCQMGNIFSSSDFDTIYEVPLDGTYIFSIFDSGQRGLGSFNRITATKVEKQFNAPYVNPGAFPPVTV